MYFVVLRAQVKVSGVKLHYVLCVVKFLVCMRLKLHAEVFRSGAVPAARGPPEGSSMASVLTSSRQMGARQHKEITIDKTNSRTFLKVKNSRSIL